MANKKTFSATLFFKPGTKKPRKYRNISNQINFTKFADSLQDLWYINYYDQTTGTYLYRVYSALK